MPTAETLERFIARVEQNAHVEAVEEFYTEDASMQENQSVARIGRDAHAENERKVLARTKSLTSRCVRPVFLNGDQPQPPLFTGTNTPSVAPDGVTDPVMLRLMQRRAQERGD